MLRQRVITALLLAPLAIAAIYLLPSSAFALLIGVVAALGVWEWAALAGWPTRGARLGWVAVWLAGAAAAAMLAPGWLAVAWPWLAAVVWLVALIVVCTYPRSASLLRARPVALALGFGVLWCAWHGAVALRALPGGAHWLLGTLALVWAADIGAYFAGRRFGGTKLAPAVSPGKSWEGVVGGTAAALAFGVAALGVAHAVADPAANGFTDRTGIVWALGMLAVVALSVLGDLFESALKRTAGVKDSGTLLPGHGGILDRIDGVVAALPFAAWFVAA